MKFDVEGGSDEQQECFWAWLCFSFIGDPPCSVLSLDLTFPSAPSGEYFWFSLFPHIPDNTSARVYCHLLVT